MYLLKKNNKYIMYDKDSGQNTYTDNKRKAIIYTSKTQANKEAKRVNAVVVDYNEG